jgi:hypothetical protein
VLACSSPEEGDGAWQHMRAEDALSGVPVVRFVGQTHAAQTLVRNKFTLVGGAPEASRARTNWYAWIRRMAMESTKRTTATTY